MQDANYDKKAPNCLTNEPTTPPLRHLDLDLEEPVGGICGAHPRHIRQVRLAKDGIDAHLAVDVQVG